MDSIKQMNKPLKECPPYFRFTNLKLIFNQPLSAYNAENRLINKR